MRLFPMIASLLSLVALMIPKPLLAYSANKVWMDFLNDGRYRVAVQYTVPALKEFREAHAIFNQKKAAEKFYWQLVTGGEFAVNGSAQVVFIPPKTEPIPW